MNCHSKNTGPAAEFARFLTSPEVQTSFAIEQSRLPTIAALYDDTDVLAANPFFSKLKPVFQGGAVARPSSATKDLYNDVSTAYFTAINQILTGQGATADLIGKLEQDLQKVVSEL